MLMIEQLCVQFGGLMFQQMIGIPKIGINCVPLLAILLRHVYEAYLFQGLLKNKNSAQI
jgi:hypothetical protein